MILSARTTYRGQRIKAITPSWMKGENRSSNDPSDRVEKPYTRHAEEGSDNTMGHHSFLVVFRRTLKGPAMLDEQTVLAEASQAAE